MFDIMRRAEEVKREIGEVTIKNVVEYIEKQGFEVIEFNTIKGDMRINELDIFKYTKGCNGRTIDYSTDFSVVIVDGSLSDDDKLHIFLHELGHVVLHMPVWDTIRKTHSTIRKDAEAEVFAFIIKNYK